MKIFARFGHDYLINGSCTAARGILFFAPCRNSPFNYKKRCLHEIISYREIFLTNKSTKSRNLTFSDLCLKSLDYQII